MQGSDRSLSSVLRDARAADPLRLGQVSRSNRLLKDLCLVIKLGEMIAAGDGQPVVVACTDQAEAGRLARLISSHMNFISPGALPVDGMPDLQLWGHGRFLDQFEAVQLRQRAIHRLHASEKAIIVASVTALATLTATTAEYRRLTLELRCGDEMPPESLADRLRESGYVEISEVSEPGEFAWRGMIFDVFPLNAEFPVRLQFLADTLTKIASFDPASQSSFGFPDRVTVAPHFDWDNGQGGRERHAQRLFDATLGNGAKADAVHPMIRDLLRDGHFQGIQQFSHLFRADNAALIELVQPGSLLAASAPATLLRALEQAVRDLAGAAGQDAANGMPTADVASALRPDAVAAALTLAGEETPVPGDGPDGAESEVKGQLFRLRRNLSGIFADKDGPAFSRFMDWYQQEGAAAGLDVLLCAADDESFKRLSRLLEMRQAPHRMEPDGLIRRLEGRTAPPGLAVCRARLESYCFFEGDRLLIASDEALLGTKGRSGISNPRRKSLQDILREVSELKPNDLVVHITHGIGRYIGITNMDAGGAKGDYLVIEYKGGDRVYLPVDRVDALQRFSANESQAPLLDQLGGATFSQKKGKARAAAQEMAAKLLKIYAARRLSEPRVFGQPSEAYLKFEADFPHQETDDQLKAIDDIEEDFRSERLMDRLICGDVGFGKTEVAIRAAMRSVLEGFQVMVLVPTTILCFQHFRSFSGRMSAYGAEVRQVNRFVKGPRISKVLHDFAEGRIDVLIGTHRLLSKDVVPKNLSLLIVDEEQRFGVGHKERIKELKASADVLTLSATPIPRTLHLAMLGLRDISLIATPPTDRLPVRTHIAKFSEDVVREAIEKELERGGQVFYVHNRVDDIEEVAAFIRRLVPSAAIAVAHGQMNEAVLEQVTMEFLEGRHQVLVCTTIIESGIDMPNVNTLIVNRADAFGLAQLYQLRGRVGRSSRQAAAYFLIPAFESVSMESLKRLEVLGHHQDLGSGFAVANFDLEIRGTGNLLGAEQSGHAMAVGLEFYTRLLEEAIAEARGGRPAPQRPADVEIRLNINAFLPADYIQEEALRLRTYRRIFLSASDTEDAGILGRVREQFGPLPAEARRLFAIVKIKRLLEGMFVLQASRKDPFTVDLRFGKLPDQARDRLLQAISSHPDRYRLLPQSRVELSLREKGKPLAAVPGEEGFLEALGRELKVFAGLIN